MSSSTSFTVISPEGEITACRTTGKILSELTPDSPYFDFVAFHLDEYIENYKEDIPDYVHIRDLGYAAGSEDNVEVYGADPIWRNRRFYLTEALADDDVKIFEGDHGPEIICVNAKYSSQADAFVCNCENSEHNECPASFYHLNTFGEDLPYEHRWPKWKT